MLIKSRLVKDSTALDKILAKHGCEVGPTIQRGVLAVQVLPQAHGQSKSPDAIMRDAVAEAVRAGVLPQAAVL